MFSATIEIANWLAISQDSDMYQILVLPMLKKASSCLQHIVASMAPVIMHHLSIK